MMPRSTRFVLLPFALLLAAACSAEVRYIVTPDPTAGKLKVSMSFDAKAGPVELQMPNWAPGAYFFGAFGRQVTDLRVIGPRGADPAVQHPADNSWKFDALAGTMTVEYSVPSALADGAMHYSGPSTYLYIVGRKEEACRLALNVPSEWKIAVGLDSIGGNDRTYSAKTYDVLADNPVTMGDFIEYSYTSHGKPVTIALRGANRANVNKDRIVSVCKAITDGEGDFFGGVPYSKYVWHFAVTPAADGGGGLEHLSSTQITLAQGVGPRSVRVCAHEFFHLWNVKRIRSKVLGPFDYTQLPKTGALYWLEGVTDYYASLLSFRYGVLDENAFKGDLVQNLTAVRSNDARLRISPYESSMRVGETNGGRGNSNGFDISYYNLGWLVGMCLDIEIRSRTGGKKSLDDVERLLWEQCKDDKPGFEEGDVRKRVIEVGGPEMGPVFDAIVMKPGELPIESLLAKVGFRLDKTTRTFTDLGFDIGPMFGGSGVRVLRTRMAINQTVSADDRIVTIEGKPIAGANNQEMMASANSMLGALKPDVEAHMRVIRDGKELDLVFTPRTGAFDEWSLADVANGDEAKLALRKSWYFAGKR